MNKYLMSIHHYFHNRTTFVIEANNKKEAVENGKIYVRQSPLFSGGNYDLNDVKCEKKLNKKKGSIKNKTF